MSSSNASIEIVTPKQAEAWLDHNYKHNRPLSTRHVAFLASEMSNGNFTTATIHFAYAGNDVHLINGQHTLNACVKSNVPFQAIVVREYIDGGEDQLAKRYMHYDIHRRRSFSDTARAFQLSEKTGIPDSWLNCVAAAIKFGKSGFGARTAGNRNSAHFVSISELFDLVQVWKNEGKISLDLLGKLNKSRPFRKSPFLSIALVTLYYQKEKAISFWQQVALDDGLSIGDPRKTLHDYAPKTVRPRGIAGGVDVLPQDVVAIAASYCWNAYMEDRPLTRISVREDVRGRPLTLVGTSYTGNQDITFWPARNRELHNIEKMWQSEGIHSQHTAKAA